MKIRTRNYADWKLLKNGCRESVRCDDSDSEDAFSRILLPWIEQVRSSPEQTAVKTRCQRIEYANLSMDNSSPEQTATQSKMNVCRERNILDQTVIVTVSKDMQPRRKITSTKDTRYKNFVCE